MKTKILLLASVLFGAVLAIHSQPLMKTHVETGDLEGILDGNLAVYKAIPYAAPPVGDLRWKEPQPAKPWTGVLKAEEFGPWPPQPSRRDGSHPKMSEDCLYLGIATPATSATDRLPVMVWIHGGGFQTEHYGGDLWKHLAQRGVVIVSVEYRAGAFGFMADPELTKHSLCITSRQRSLQGRHQSEWRLVCALERREPFADCQRFAKGCRTARSGFPEASQEKVGQTTPQDGCT